MAKKERYVIIRSKNAGAFAGILLTRNGGDVVMKNSRRLWYWSGAASLSQLAINGTSQPEKCKFPEAVKNHEIFEVIEVLDCTDEARKSIEGVPAWRV